MNRAKESAEKAGGLEANRPPVLHPPVDNEKLCRPDERLEPLLADRGYILQKRQGYRFSIDALLLANLVTRLQKTEEKAVKEIRYMDLGTGCGIVPVLLAKWNRFLAGYGVEIQESLASVARRNLRLHGLEERFRILCMDMKALPSRFPARSFDWITINPPYRRLNTGRVNPDPQKAMARHEVAASLKDICNVMGTLLREKGRAFLIYPASRFSGLVTHLNEAGLEPKYVQPVYSKPEEGARWVLMEAVCRGSEQLFLDRPLVLENGRGNYTEEVNKMFCWEC